MKEPIMVQGENGQNHIFNHTVATVILKTLWTTYNNATIYGINHPMAKNSASDLYRKLLDTLSTVSPLTIHIEDESLFCESWKIEKKGFATRLITRFKSAGIHSVAFEKGLSPEAFSLFITMLNDPGNFGNVERMKETLYEKDFGGVELNFVTYQKVQSDEIIVRENFGEFVKNLTAENIISQSDRVVKNLRARIKTGGSVLLVDYLMKMRERIPLGVIDSRKLPPPNEILEALTVLKKGVIVDLQADSATGVIDKMGEEAIRELTNITDEVIVKIIGEEYRAGLKSPTDLALLIKRLVPDTINLKRLMPKIKEVLLAGGMSLTEYLEMVRCLAGELEGGSLIDILKNAGEEIGVSVNEIVKDLKDNPQASVRLIVLASEIRSQLSGSDDEFIPILSDYIERVCMKMTRDEIEESGKKDYKNIEKILSRLEREMLNDLGENGVEQVKIDLVENSLTMRLSDAAGWLKNDISGVAERVNASATPTGMGDTDSNRNVSEGKVPGEGANSENVIIGKMKPVSKKIPSLPREVHRIKDTKKYLQREIWRNNRYKTQFACLSVSIVHVNDGEKPSDEKVAGIFVEICRILSESIRSLDLVGSLGSLADNYMLLILTETTQDGADILRGRLEKKFNTIKISFNGEEMVPKVRVSAVSYDGETKPKMTAFVRKVKANHKQPFKD